MKDNKMLIIDCEQASNKDLLIVKAMREYAQYEQMIKEFTERKEQLKEKLKKYDFNQIKITNSESDMSMTITQYERDFKTFDKDKFIKMIKENNSLDEDLKVEIIGQLELAYTNKTTKICKIVVK